MADVGTNPTGVTTITQYGFVIDNRKCIGCHACTVACKAEHDDPIGVNKTWVKYIEKGEFPNTNRRFSVMRCNHCDDSPCTDVCPTTALWEREDGIVDFDSERCIGCKACMQGCPYDALYIDPNTETAAKCNYCSHRVDSGREPACVTVCPEDAIIAGDMENPDTEISETIASEEVQARKVEKGTEPKLFYVDGDEASTTPGTTAREEHYMWSDAPNQVETRGAAREEFDIEKAAQSLADSDVSLPGEEARPDGGGPGSARDGGGSGNSGGSGNCGCDSCQCGKGDDAGSGRGDGGNGGQFASDGGYDTAAASGSGASSATGAGNDGQSRTARAYELLHEEARRVYDVGETHYRSWGWEVYAYTWTKSIGAGVFLLATLAMLGGLLDPTADLVAATAFVGTVFVAITTVLLVLDLEQPQRFHWVVLRPNWNSWLVKGAYLLIGYSAFLGLVLVGWLAGLDSLLTNPITLAVGAALATGAAVYTAFLFSQSKGRDLWQSPAMPLHMFAQAILAGGATAAILGATGLFGLDALVEPGRLGLLAGLLTHAVLVASEIFTPHQTEDAEEAAARIVRGPFRTAFWAGGVVVGVVAPLVVLAVGGGALLGAVAGVLALGGLLAFEYCWITAPQTISLA